LVAGREPGSHGFREIGYLIGAEHGHLLHVQTVDLPELRVEEGERRVVGEAHQETIYHMCVGPAEDRYVQDVPLEGANPGSNGSEGTGAVGDLDNESH
jgi:hypothetical protein